MRTLYMVRHAKSSWDNLGLADHDRPLNGRGKRNAPEMGQRLRDRDVRPDLLLSSTAKRARTTAKKIAEQIGYPVEKILLTRDLYHADEDDIIGVVQSVDDHFQSLMIFGHNPGFTDCVNELTESDIYNIPTCGIAEISFEVSQWNQIGPSKGTLTHYDFPKKSAY